MTAVIRVGEHTATVERLAWSSQSPILRAMLEAAAGPGCMTDQQAADDAVCYFQSLGFDAAVMADDPDQTIWDPEDEDE